MPFPLKFIASYLIEDDNGWTVVDPGFDYPPAREAWESEAARMGLDLGRDVTRIIVTHLHLDHIGLARWLEGRVIHTLGHSDFHFVLHDERRRLLFAGGGGARRGRQAVAQDAALRAPSVASLGLPRANAPEALYQGCAWHRP